MTVFTPSLRLSKSVPGDPAVKNAWGTILNENMTLVEAAILGTASVSIAGLTTYSLTTANGAPDQSRPFIQSYTGALTGNCTVTIPNEPKIGWAQNSTTGGFNVILTAGAGTTATVPPDGSYYWYKADGATNVALLASLSPTPSLPPPGVQFGDFKDSGLGIEADGWRLCYGQTRPRTDALWVWLVAQGLTGSWVFGSGDGSTTYTMPDCRDVAFFGLGNMGGADKGLITSAGSGVAGATLGATGGDQVAPRHGHAVIDPGHGHSVNDPGHLHAVPSGVFSVGSGGFGGTPSGGLVGGGNTSAAFTGIGINASGTGISIQDSGAGYSQNMPPAMMAAKMMYVGA